MDRIWLNEWRVMPAIEKMAVQVRKKRRKVYMHNNQGSYNGCSSHDTTLSSHSCCHKAKIHILEEVSNDPSSHEVEHYCGLDDNNEEKAFGFSADGMSPCILASFSTNSSK